MTRKSCTLSEIRRSKTRQRRGFTRYLYRNQAQLHEAAEGVAQILTSIIKLTTTPGLGLVDIVISFWASLTSTTIQVAEGYATQSCASYPIDCSIRASLDLADLVVGLLRLALIFETGLVLKKKGNVCLRGPLPSYPHGGYYIREDSEEQSSGKSRDATMEVSTSLN